MVPDLIHGEPQTGHYIFKGDALVMFEPLFGSRNRALFFFAGRFVINRSIADSGNRISQHFEQPGNGIELTRVKLIEHMVSVLFVHGHLLQFS